MNSTQKVIFLSGLIAISMMGLFPPWKVAGPRGLPLEYGAIYAPPVPLDPQKAQEGIEIDFKRLLLQIAVVAILSGGLIKVSADQIEVPEKGSKPGSLVDNKQEEMREEEYDEDEEDDDEDDDDNVVPLETVSKGKTIKLSLPEGRIYGEFLVEAEDDPDSWEWYADAQGKVELPAGRPVQLEVTGKDNVDLSFLSLLKEDTLHSIDLTNCRLKDWELSNLSKLTGLKELDLTGSTISSEAINFVGELSQLEKLWLDGTAVDDQSVSSLNKLSKLKKLSIKKTKITASGIKELKDKLDNCLVES